MNAGVKDNVNFIETSIPSLGFGTNKLMYELTFRILTWQIVN